MKKLNPEFVGAVLKLVNSCPYFAHLGMRITLLERGVADMEMDLERAHLQAFGFVHGGAIASLIDTAAFWSAFCEIDASDGITSVDLNVNYLAPCRKGRLTATGRRIKLGRKLGLGEASIFDEGGKLVGHGTSTIMVVPGLGLENGFDLPPKFLP